MANPYLNLTRVTSLEVHELDEFGYPKLNFNRAPKKNPYLSGYRDKVEKLYQTMADQSSIGGKVLWADRVYTKKDELYQKDNHSARLQLGIEMKLRKPKTGRYDVINRI